MITQQIANAIASRKEDVAKKNALSKMVEDKEDFLEELKSQRHGVFEVRSIRYNMLSKDYYHYRRSMLCTRRSLIKLNNSD